MNLVWGSGGLCRSFARPSCSRHPSRSSQARCWVGHGAGPQALSPTARWAPRRRRRPGPARPPPPGRRRHTTAAASTSPSACDTRHRCRRGERPPRRACGDGADRLARSGARTRPALHGVSREARSGGGPIRHGADAIAEREVAVNEGARGARASARNRWAHERCCRRGDGPLRGVPRGHVSARNRAAAQTPSLSGSRAREARAARCARARSWSCGLGPTWLRSRSGHGARGRPAAPRASAPALGKTPGATRGRPRAARRPRRRGRRSSGAQR